MYQPVARHLGDDRGRRNRGDQSVTADHRLAVAAAVDAVAAVDIHKPRLDRRADTARASAHNEARRIF